MVKKLLNLSLVAVILSVAVFVSPLSIDAYAADEKINYNITGENEQMEVLSVTKAEDGTQTVKKYAFTDNARPEFTENSWALIKINVDENLEFDSEMTLQLQFYHTAGSAPGYCAPLSGADFEAAKIGATFGTLVKPTVDNCNWTSNSRNRSNNSPGNSTITFKLDGTVFNNSPYYQNGCIYLAVWGDATGLDYCNLGTKNNAANFILTASATKVAPAVNDFSDAEVTYDKTTGAYTVTTTTTSGTAMLIVASFDATGMVDAKVTTINAEDAESGVISGNIGALDEGTSVKAFLWNPTTLAPIINVVPIP